MVYAITFAAHVFETSRGLGHHSHSLGQRCLGIIECRQFGEEVMSPIADHGRQMMPKGWKPSIKSGIARFRRHVTSRAEVAQTRPGRPIPPVRLAEKLDRYEEEISKRGSNKQVGQIEFRYHFACRQLGRSPRGDTDRELGVRRGRVPRRVGKHGTIQVAVFPGGNGEAVTR